MTLLKEYAVIHEFMNYKATKRLQELASDPYLLNKTGNLTPQRVEEFCAFACGIKLIYATERIDKNILEVLRELAQESQAHKKMEKMQAGEVMNFISGYPSEERQVLHTATRDFFEYPNRSEKAMIATKQARQEIDKLKAFIAKIDQEHRFTDLIMIGIGGSDLGPRAHYHALQHLLKPGRNLHFICNIDPDDTALALQGVNLSRSLVVVISKSGTTLETTVNEELVRRRFEHAGLNANEHFISVTGQGSPLDDPKKYLACFYIWDWIGGRFSTTSMVGGVLLSFAFGFDVYWEFLKGAAAMDKVAVNQDLNRNLPLLGALLSIWNHNFLNYPTLAILPYSQVLHRFPAHIQQVEMESNGKRIDQTGKPVSFQTAPIIWGEPGTNAQHSFYQLLHQGTSVVPVEMIGFKECQSEQDDEIDGTTSQEKLLANLFAQAIGLAIGKKADNPNKTFPGNRPSHILLAKKLTPFSLGALLAYYEHKVAFQGFIWNINSFDQEGVQLGKHLVNDIIAHFAGKEKTPDEATLLTEAFLAHLKDFNGAHLYPSHHQ